MRNESHYNHNLNIWKEEQEHTHSFGIKCRMPRDETQASLVLRVSKAELCGKSMRIPYKHLNRSGYLSGSNSCNRRPILKE